MTEQEFIEWLRSSGDELATPCYLYDRDRLDASLSQLQALLPEGARVFYSLKANPQPAIVNALHQCGAGAEIASPGERYACRLAGVAPEDILMGGVAKSAQQLQSGTRQQAVAVVIDSLPEWQRLKAIAGPQAEFDVLLRVNPGIALGGLDMAGNSQFGLAPEQAMEIARDSRAINHVEFLGLHAYFGSQRLKPEPIVATAAAVADLVDDFKAAELSPRVVNIGLGLGIPYLAKDTDVPHALVRERLHEVWRRAAWRDVQLWSEAGRYLVASSGYFVARVIETKLLHGKGFVFLDGGLNAHNPGLGLGRLFRSNPRFIFPKTQNASPQEVDIVGNLCTSSDCIGRQVTAPPLAVGDLVGIPNAGAYCQTTGLWGFNSQPPFNEAMLVDGRLKALDPQHRLLASAHSG